MVVRRSLFAWLAAAAASSRSPSSADALLPSMPSSHRDGGAHHGKCRDAAAGAAGCISAAALFVGGARRPDGDICRLRMSSNSLSTAPPSPSSAELSKLTVPQLKSRLKQLNLPVSGVKAELIRRLEGHRTSSSPTTAVQEEDGDDRPEQSSNGIKNNRQSIRSSSIPPPKDETEIRVVEKEVLETVRMLDGLKLGGGGGGAGPPGAADPSTSRRLSRQKQQEKELMESLKQSLRQSQRGNGNKVSPDPTVLDDGLRHHVDQLSPRPANELKEELASLRLSVKGRKPDLVNRLANYYASRDATEDDDAEEEEEDGGLIDVELPAAFSESTRSEDGPIASFAGIPRLSAAASAALSRAFGASSSVEPTPIQSVAIPKLFNPPHPSALLHAPTGSGKTIAFLLPVTETLWKEVEGGMVDVDDMASGMALVLTPTRELAAQVAGVASVLAPPGMVRLVPRPMDLMSFWKDGDQTDRGEEFEYLEREGIEEAEGAGAGRKYRPRILVGSAKSVSASLFGGGKMPGTPTNKPQGKELLSSVRWLAMDEVDRLLDVKKSRTDKRSRHEKPAAMLSAAVARLTVGRAQVIAASATVGRPLRRELARVLGLHSSECPETLRGEEDDAKMEERMQDDGQKHVGRAVKIPAAVRNYVLPVDGSTSGSLLTSAAFASKSILQQPDSFETSGRRVLLVLTQNCGIKVHNALGALRHLGVRPEPRSLLDALEADGADRLVEAHRKVSGVEGVGGGARQQKRSDGENEEDGEGYLLVTHEDNVRGLHLDSLDAVIVVGRPAGPDEYTHIAGRTGRAGRRGSVLNVVSFEQAAAMASWTKMLGVDFLPVDENGVASIVDGG